MKNKKKISFRSKEAKIQAVSAWRKTMYTPQCNPEQAKLAMAWMFFCDRTGRRYDNDKASLAPPISKGRF